MGNDQPGQGMICAEVPLPPDRCQRISVVESGIHATATPRPTCRSPSPYAATTTSLGAISPSPSPSPLPTPVESFGFDALKETFNVDVDVPLAAPFTIASSRLVAVNNVAVRVELRSGAVGWGEAPVLPSVTAEDQPAALHAAGRACAALAGAPAALLGALLQDVASVLPGHAFASARAGVEMALIDAVANSIRIPLWRLFGGASDSVTTDITIPIVTPNEAAQLAAKYRGQGFQTLKLKKIINGNLAHVINIKLTKLGVLGALEIIDAARKANIALMIGGMVETRIALGFAGHLAAGLGCFSFVDLDTPVLLSEDPVYGGYEAFGPVYKFTNAIGHGGFLHHFDSDASLHRSIAVHSNNALFHWATIA
ncbi:unnamed protein product [Miscanthus lutarioriparius]|uniref:Mandelate racemase/muconate lactonizing enzyme N-terminal domain-containing protein n=1 Tax=Miscanthus lutarioriparius TaxID=422564 RepID=A0A811NZV8_9POAL|nr:unnamed protein product [Miscanthus lutarioriparius]